MHIYTDAVIKMCSKMVTLLVRNDAGQSLQKKTAFMVCKLCLGKGVVCLSLVIILQKWNKMIKTGSWSKNA